MKTAALILDKSHRILVRASGQGMELAGFGFADLAVLKQHFAGLGLILPGPVGVDPPRFAFLVDGEPAAPLGFKWVSIRDAQRDLGFTHYWEIYVKLMLGGFDPGTRDIDVFHFGNTPFMAARLAHLVVKGNKRLTAGNPEAMAKTGTTLPWAGLISIVTDGFGVPICVIRTKKVEKLRFKKVTVEIAINEGEGDLSLSDWRQGHWEYFTSEANKLGLTFTEESEIVVERFELLKTF